MSEPEPITVLMLQAGASREQLDLGAEHRAVIETVSRSRYRDALRFETAQTVQPEDLSYLLMRHTPTVLHLSGHGRPDSGTLLRAADGGLVPIAPDGLCQLIAEAGPQIRAVVLNSCWSDDLAEAIAKVFGCAIGLSGQVADHAARAFSAEFYQALAFGHPVGPALRITRAALTLHGVERAEHITLATAPDVNADHLFLLRAAHQRTPPRDGRKPNATLVTATTAKRHFIAVITGPEDSAHSLPSTFENTEISIQSVSWISDAHHD